MAPPTQRGRFKPRKPAKKIAAPKDPTAAAATAPVPDAAPSSARAGRKPAGGRGRSGRGRGRTPLPRGQVFFTGNEKVAATNKKGDEKSSSSGHKRAAMRSSNDEEIVATVDGGVGSTDRLPTAKSNDTAERRDTGGWFNPDDVAPMIGTGLHYYESDSSAEAEPTTQVAHPETVPITLPHQESGRGDSSQSTLSDKIKDQGDRGEWFLVQLPTRLPKVTPPMTSHVKTEAGGDDKGAAADETNNPTDESIPGGAGMQTALVATKPILESSFDNSLTKAKAGRFGKIRIYKSGRSELVLSNGVRLNLMEGMSCSFEQHAVAIDLNNSSFVPMGKVQSTLVATPKVNNTTTTQR